MNTRLRCLLLDDELPGLTLLKMLCEEIEGLEVVKAFNDPDVFLSEVNNLTFDICILDIGMPRRNGIEIANILSGKPVIFTTAYKDFAADAFEIDAIDYILKPIKKNRLAQAIKKAMDRVSLMQLNKSHQLQMLTDQGRTILHLNEFCYIRTSDGDSRDKVVYMKDGSNATLKNINFETLLDLLKDYSFARLNRKEAVSKNVIQSFTSEMVVVAFPSSQPALTSLSLSETYRHAFLRLMEG